MFMFSKSHSLHMLMNDTRVCVCVSGMLAGYDGTPRLRGRPSIVKREQKEETSTHGPKILSALGKRSRVPSR